MKTLTQNAHLTLDRDVYLYGYDWRLPLDQQGMELKNYITQVLKDRPTGTRVKLIGHSLGGLVIRSYLTNNPSQHKVESALTIGTPHQGTLIAYPMWEKGEVWTDNWLMKIAISQLTAFCRYTHTSRESRSFRSTIKTPKEVVQTLVPSLKQILPTFDYLKVDGKIKPVNTLLYQNDWLPVHPFAQNFFNVDFVTLSGSNTPTLRYFEIMSPSASEIAAGDWLDGKPINKQYIPSGDGTVLNLSSQIDQAENQIIPGNHGEIMATDYAIEKILDFLGLPQIQPVRAIPIPEEITRKVITVSLSQTAYLKLTDPKGEMRESQDNIIVIFDPVAGNYLLNIISPVNTSATLYLLQMEKDRESVDKRFTLHLRKNVPYRLTFSYR